MAGHIVVIRSRYYRLIQNYKDKAKEGRNDISSYYTKKVKKAKAAFGNGAKALWSRQVLELKKSGINMSYIRYLINPIYVAIMSLLGMELIELVIFLMFINLSPSHNLFF